MSHSPLSERAVRHRAVAIASVCALWAVSTARAGDWPQLLGPNRDGAAVDERIIDALPPDGPPVRWRKDVGEGWAGPVIADGKLVLFHRLGDEDVVECLDAATGEPIWTFAYPTDYRDDFGFDEGPRAVPTIAGGAVYTFGAQGMLHRLDLETGRRQWAVDTRSRYGSAKNFFGRGSSPLVTDGLVMLILGGRDGAGIAAFDARSGELAWRATDRGVSYASPVLAEIGGRRYALCLMREGLVALNPLSGEVRFEQPFRSPMRNSVHAATPLVVGDLVFLSACYGAGAAVYRITGDGPQPLWASDEALSNHYAASVHHDGYLYGFHERQDVPPPIRLRCVELRTGELQWEAPRMGAGAVMLADGKLIVLTERGELLIAPATPDGFRPTRAKVLGFEIRAHPALAGGLLYARDKGELRCLDLRPRPAANAGGPSPTNP